MRRTRVLKFGSIAAAVAAVSMWMLPAWGQSGSLPPEAHVSAPRTAQQTSLTRMGWAAAAQAAR
jgi:hypothetical protein